MRIDGRYDTLRELGRGSAGVVYLVADRLADGRRLALKTLHGAAAAPGFDSEFRTLALLCHPHLAEVHDFGHDRENGLVYFTSDYVAGEPLAWQGSGRPFSWLTERTLELCDVLDYLHRQDFLHCDLKPENVLVERGSERVKLLDFGLAIARSGAGNLPRGTLPFVAPEWLRGGVPDARSDLYGLGMLLYLVTYGRLPFEAGAAEEVIRFHLEGTLRFPPRPAGVPAWWEAVLGRLLARAPEERYPSASAVLRDLQRRQLPAATRPGAAEPAAAGPPPAEPRHRAALGGGAWIERGDILADCRRDVATALAEPPEPGAPLLLLVVGAPGLGKTRLLAELRRGAQLNGHPVVSIGAHAAGAGALARLEAAVAGDLGPERGAGDGGHAPAQSHVDTCRLRVTRLGDALVATARRDGLLLLVDDAAALDGPAQLALAYALRASEYSRAGQSGEPWPRLCVVAALQPDELAHPAWAPLVAERFTHRRDLPPLSPAGIEALLLAVLGERPLPEALRRDLNTLGAGVPGFVLALLDGLSAQGALRLLPEAVAYAPTAEARGPLPATLEQSLLRAVQALEAPAQALLTAVALGHGPLTAASAGAAAGLTAESAEAALATLVARGLVTAEPGVRGRAFVPTSPLLRAVLRGQVAPAAASPLHAALFAALAAEEPPDEAGAAYHALHAGGSPAGREFALRAAAAARREGRFEAALEALGWARAMADGESAAWLAAAAEEVDLRTLLGDLAGAADVAARAVAAAEADGNAERRAEAVLQLAEVRLRQGDPADVAALLAPLVAGPAGTAAAAPRRAAHVVLGRAALLGGDYATAERLSREALTLGGRNPADWLAARALTTLGLVAYYRGEADEAHAQLERAEAALVALDQRRELAYTANARALVHHRQGAYEAAVAAYRRSLELARDVGDAQRETIARMNLSVVLQQTGAYRAAIDAYHEALESAYRVGDWSSLVKIENNLGNLHRFVGRLDEAEAYIARSLDLADRLGDRRMQAFNRLILGEIHLFRGENEAAERRIRDALERFRAMELVDEGLEAQIDLAAWLRQNGRLGEATDAARQIAEAARAHGLTDHQARGLLLAAAVQLEAGEPLAALRAGLGAYALIAGRDAPELLWRVHATLAQAQVRLGATADAAYHLGRTEVHRRHLEETVPVEFRAGFFDRPDRRALRDAVAGIDIAEPPPSAAPAGAPDRDALLQLLDITKQLNSEVRLDRLLNAIMDAVVTLTGAERGFVILRDGDKLKIPVARNMDQETIRKSALKISHSIAERVIESGETIFTYDAMEDERYRDFASIHTLKLRSVLCMPLKERNEPFGAVYLDNRFQACAFDESHRGLLEAFAEQAAVAITNARLHERSEAAQQALERSRDEVQRLNLELEKKVSDQAAKLHEAREALVRHQNELEQRYRYGSIIGSSEGIRRVYALIDRVKDIDVPVIVQGESGTGKELVARAVHFNGARRKREFVSLNCAAFPETLLESELFGYKRGAFTGADRDKKGLFLVAHTGTLFLDEVGDMSLGMQAKLLRALQENEIRPVGSHESIHIDVRIIAASNKDLKDLIARGLFREDLFYRLSVVTILVPPLRQRREDILLLAEHFLGRIAKQTGGQARTLSRDAQRVLLNYGWPGNVRELESTVTTASLFCSGPEIGLADLANKPELLESQGRPTPPAAGADAGRTLDELEREAIVQALVRTNGNKVAAAKVLGISRRSLYNKIAQHGIQLSRKTTVLR